MLASYSIRDVSDLQIRDVLVAVAGTDPREGAQAEPVGELAVILERPVQREAIALLVKEGRKLERGQGSCDLVGDDDLGVGLLDAALPPRDFSLSGALIVVREDVVEAGGFAGGVDRDLGGVR